MSGLPEETTHHETVVCPWCGHHHSDGWEMVDFNHEEFIDHECDKCLKPIRCRVQISHTYICAPVGA